MSALNTEEAGLWAYVHRELDEHERKAVELAVCDNPKLAAQLAKITAADRTLRELLPLTRLTDEGLADRILEALPPTPASMPDRSSATAEGLSFVPAARRLAAVLARPLTYEIVSLAAAAALMLAAIPYHLPGPAVWGPPQFATAVYRSGEPAHYTAQDAAACLATLKKVIYVDGRRHARWIGRPAWELSFSFDDLGDGRAAIHVAGKSATGRDPKNWTATYASLTECLRNTPEIGRRIVSDLATADLAAPSPRKD